MKTRISGKTWISLLLVLCLLSGLTGCGGSSSGSNNNEPAQEHASVEDISDDSSVPSGSFRDSDFVPYKAPPLRESVFHEEKATGDDKVKLDLSTANEGYVGVRMQAEDQARARVVCGENKYDYYIPNDGTVVFLPLQWGSGTYEFFICEKIANGNHAVRLNASVDAKIEDEFDPFLRPNVLINYTKDSACVKKAAELAAECETALDVVKAVMDYLCVTVSYDNEKASTVKNPYLPDVDEIIKTGKGICFDYSAVAATMLRSQGIPTKMVFGDVAPNQLYHAWNMIYTEETGWIMVKYQVNKESWNRLDITFYDNGTSEEYIGDGSNYTDTHYF